MENHSNRSESDTNIFDTTLLNMIGEIHLTFEAIGIQPTFLSHEWVCYSVQQSNGIWLSSWKFMQIKNVGLFFSSACFPEMLLREVTTCNSCFITKFENKNMYAVSFSWWNPLIFMKICLVKTPHNPQINTSYPHLQSAQCSLLFRLYWVP